jgi:RNA polymerase sigma-70 factor (ECF subfamily)
MATAHPHAERQSSNDFSDLYRRYHRLVRHQVRQICSPNDVEDVVQDTFLRVFRKLHTFRGDAPLEGWIARIARNSALMQRRRSVVRHEVCAGDELIQTQVERRDNGDDDSPALRLARKRQFAALQAGLDALDDDRRRILTMRGEEYSLREIADEFGVSEGAVKSRLHRARAALRAELAPQNFQIPA